MATHTIGTGGDFSTPQAWEDDIPATLTEQRIGQCKNEEFDGAGAGFAIVFSAHVTTSSFNIILEAEAGSSFKDHADVRTNPLRYAATGARLTQTASSFEALKIVGNVGHLIVRNLMLKNTEGTAVAVVRIDSAITTSIQFKDLILEYAAASSSQPVFSSSTYSGDLRLDNVVAIQRNDAGNGIGGAFLANITINGCTVVRPSNITAAGTGLKKSGYGTSKVFSTVVAGFSTDCDAGFDSTSDYNATTFSDGASGLPDPASDHNVYSITYDTALFVQPSDAGGSHDFRTLTGSALVNMGLLDATNAPDDISGTARENPPEIGAWELAAAAAARRLILSTPTG